MAKGFDVNTAVGIGLLLVITLVVGGFFNIGPMAAMIGKEAVDQPSTVTPQGAVCNAEITPDLNVRGYDIANPGTAITENFAYRKVGLKSWTTGTLGTELSGLVYGAEYEIVPGIDAANGIDNPYGESFFYTVKCQEDDEIAVPLYNDEVEGSVTATFYNNDDNAAAETFSAGQTQDVRIKLQTGTDESFGNPFLDMSGILVISLNASEWDRPEKVMLSDGTVLQSTSVPQRYDLEGLAATDFTEYAYKMPAITDVATNIVLRLNADDTNAPSVDGNAYMFAGTYFINGDTANIEIGVETEEGVDIAVSDSVSVVLDFTA